MTLPEDFLKNMSLVVPRKEFEAFVKALADDQQTTSIRFNRAKFSAEEAKLHFGDTAQVGWCEEGLYLDHRPQFTLDPLLHAGAYYVQEASRDPADEHSADCDCPNEAAPAPYTLDLPPRDICRACL